MLHIIFFHDKVGAQSDRESLMAVHLDWIKKNRAWILLAGSLRDAPGIAPVGGLWVVDVASKEDALEKIKSDPFWIKGIRTGVDVFYWGMALPDMEVSATDFCAWAAENACVDIEVQ